MAKRQKAVDIRTMREEQRAQRLLTSGHQDHEMHSGLIYKTKKKTKN